MLHYDCYLSVLFVQSCAIHACVCRFLFMWYALLALAVLCLALYLFVYTIICCLCCSVCVADLRYAVSCEATYFMCL